MAINIKADFTCDNSYAIWLGTSNQVHTLIRQETNTLASQIFSGEHFSFTANKNDYLYVIAWSDDAVKQGLIGTFNGGVSVQMGDPIWEVLPTNNDKDNNQFPTLTEINSYLPGASNNWKKPFIGPLNSNTNSIYPGANPVSGIDINANWVWYDSNNSGNPFNGRNHQEFLIFRTKIKHLISCCSPCEDSKSNQEQIIANKALSKVFTIKGNENNNKRCAMPYSKDTCSLLDIPNLEPCFYLHWGDSKNDQIETHDDEIMYITVCNPYSNITFKGITITDVTIIPQANSLPNGEEDIQIIPNSLICFDTIESCTCSSRAVTLLTRGAKAQQYTIQLNYCIDSISINHFNKGKNSFKIELINS